MRITGNRLDEYRDGSGLMGFSEEKEDTKKCFNTPKSYQSGWYHERDVALDSSSLRLTHTIDNPWIADFVGVADYDKVSGEELVTVKLDHATTPYYIGFNRKTGIHEDTKGPEDKVVVSSQNEDGQSWLLAGLGDHEVYDIADYFGPGEDARIQVLEFSTQEPITAKVAIYPFVDRAICLDDISLAGQVGSATYDSLPIKIISQDTTSITIQVSNTWGGDVLSNMFTRYDDTSFKTACPELREVTKTQTAVYTIACMANEAVAHVDIFVSETSFSTESGATAVVPQCCHPHADFVAPAVQYIFMLQCVSQCPTEGIKRNLLRGSSQAKKGN
jgi:hypothetical protein